MQKQFPGTFVFQLDPVQYWAYQHTIFTKEECEKIIALGESLVPQDAKILTGDQIENNTTIRDSKVAWLHPTEETNWVFSRISNSIISLNDQYFKFDLFGMIEGLQFTKYEAPSGHYGRHVDRLTGGLVRKLSITLQLSAPDDYEGGEVHLIYGNKPVVVSKEQGYLVAFPSYTPHQVQPITKGTRYSLVCWVTGPAFK